MSIEPDLTDASAGAEPDPRLQQAFEALRQGRPDAAEEALLEILDQETDDVRALKLLAEAVNAQGRDEDAQLLLARALKLAPEFAAARYRHAAVLLQLNKLDRALAEIDILLQRAPLNPKFRTMKGHVLTVMGKADEACLLYAALAEEFPARPDALIQYGHSSRLAGRPERAAEAYRKALERFPDLGVAYWSLANIDSARISDAEIDGMVARAERSDLPVGNRAQFHYALGKVFEDRGDYERSFAHYRRGADLWRATVRHDPSEARAHTASVKRLFSAEFFRARAGWGDPSPDPIFIVGMPRSGSTLVEQILASHSTIEATMELPDITTLAKRFDHERAPGEPGYPEVLCQLTAEASRALGAEYLARTRPLRRLGRPFFLDKMPRNFAHIPLIQLILPNARIVDVRRHPMACCFSNFKQLFEQGQSFSYDFGELGGYYGAYVELMTHIDRVLPGKVHRVEYERLVEDPRDEIGRLLDYLGLPFEPQCLNAHETERPVLTASSEQVRRPIYASAREHWRNYEPWLQPLREALGPVLETYPGGPE